MLQRVCWNSNDWRGPTGDRFGKESSYVGKNGFGHEEWNFNTSDLIDGMVYGYAYYRPSEGTPQFKSWHDIYFFAIEPDLGRQFVGYYKDARFLSEKERAALKRKFQTSDVLEKRIDELLSLGLPTIPTAKRAEKYLVNQFSINIEVAPEDVHSLPHRRLTSADIGGRDPKRLSRYAKPLFLTHPPSISHRKRAPTPQYKTTGIVGDLTEDGYLRYTEEQRKVIRPVHKQLSNRFRAWLKSADATKVVGEASSVDVYCACDGARYLFELKVCFQQNTRLALREAIGQLLEYRFYPGRPAVDHLGIVLDAEPSAYDIAWHAALQQASVPIELYWLKGDSVFSARITKQAIAERAKPREP
jgi:hypothetical protein